MIRTIIIDDEKLAREGLKNLLKEYNDIEIIAEASNADEGIDLIEKLKPQLVFLDIQMPEKTGFEMLEELIESPAIIFTTAYNEFAIKAFEVNALDYILKPIEKTRLSEAIVKIRKQIAINEEQFNSQVIAEDSHIFIRDGERCWFIKINEVRLIESNGNYAKIYFEKFQPLIHRTLNALDARLSPKMFFRANRQQIVNLNFIDKIETFYNSGLLFYMKDGTKVEVSRRQAVKFKDLMSL
jgi:two-component system LytT family response regulator